MLDTQGFDKWAGDYDEFINKHLHSFPFCGYYDVLAAVQSLIPSKKDVQVLDVGIGTGLLSYELYKSGCQVYGIDFSPKMIVKAKSKMPNGVFEVVDISADNLGNMKNHKYDYVISSYFLHHLSPQQQVSFLNNIAQNNLNRGGKIIVADIGFASREEFDKAFIEYERLWDKDEFYLCGEEIVQKLVGLKAEYKQISTCAGILCCE
ncbi:class I SAM-dependent methyltransferase [Candidatus Uabimicrobium amorphum]|uniref:Putative methyltransferase n=1 Tax=Uabimicrobium amorphum TaxID=2596890 RepID=A0A5S9IMZ2_UABAM|nr:class I SAM-dependent methyltransferase [Candidatus Uabimicrobium amorphum]BBM84406.1 putative methyltransferase [Candidatus Uabimicrobium amorphum]